MPQFGFAFGRVHFAVLCLSVLTASCQSRGAPGVDVPTAALTPAERQLRTRARALHDRIITIDSHSGFTNDPLRSCEATDRQVDLPKMRTGGLDAVFFTVYAAQRERNAQTYAEARRHALDVFRSIHDIIGRCAQEVSLARTPEDVERIVTSGKLAVVIGMENGFVIGRDLSLLQTYGDMGAAYIGLTHNGHNDIADSWTPSQELGDKPSEHGGVSAFGGQVIAEMNRLGIMVDVSHMSKAARLDAIRLSRAPVIDSHSSMHALVNHQRNMDDETLVALVRKGGVVQITPVPFFVKYEPPEIEEEEIALFREFNVDTITQANRLPPARRAEFQRRYASLLERWPLPGVSTFVDHIDHAVKLVGVEHVGIGSDFDGGGQLTGWADASETTNVTAELLRRGYTEEDVRKIWGGNLLRVWREVRRISGEARSGSRNAMADSWR